MVDLSQRSETETKIHFEKEYKDEYQARLRKEAEIEELKHDKDLLQRQITRLKKEKGVESEIKADLNSESEPKNSLVKIIPSQNAESPSLEEIEARLASKYGLKPLPEPSNSPHYHTIKNMKLRYCPDGDCNVAEHKDKPINDYDPAETKCKSCHGPTGSKEMAKTLARCPWCGKNEGVVDKTDSAGNWYKPMEIKL